MVVDLSSRHEGVQFGQQLRRCRAADVLRQLIGMAADIAQGAGRAVTGGIRAPAECAWILRAACGSCGGRRYFIGQPILGVFHLQQPQLT